MEGTEALAGFRFDWQEFEERARARLLRQAPPVEPGVRIPAAVLVPVVKREPQASVLLTQRTVSLANHAGQVAFPGGKIDRCDADPSACALRETFEETGLDPFLVRVVGYLDAYQTGSGFNIIPVVALVDTDFVLSPATGEVDAVFEVPLAFLMDPRHHLRQIRDEPGGRRHSYAMPWGERHIWGATAGMLRNLYECLYAGERKAS